MDNAADAAVGIEGLKMDGAGFIPHAGRRYTDEENRVWATLAERRMQVLEDTASSAFLDGLEHLQLPMDRVPLFDDVNARLAPMTGWTVRAVNGFIPARMFMASLAERRFPSTLEIRPASQLEYLQEPDIFHDMFGHVPMHTHTAFADFLQAYGRLADSHARDGHFDELARLFWYTVEFGLISEGGRTKLYGSGLMSSFGEADYALDNGPELRPFNLEEVITTPFRIDVYQPLLFVIDGFDQLIEAVDALRQRWVRAAA